MRRALRSPLIGSIILLASASRSDASAASVARRDTDPTAPAGPSALGADPPPIVINEIRVDQFGPDADEYFELSGPPGTVLNNVQYVALGDLPSGEIEMLVDLTGQVIPPSGYLVVAEESFSLGPADLTTALNFENDDTVTHLLVSGLSADLSDNLDGNADGVLDSTPWLAVLDTVVLFDPRSDDLEYGPGSSCVEGPTCQRVDDGLDGPNHVFRCLDGTGSWQIGNVDLDLMPILDTPGAPNDCAICGDTVVEMNEDCDDGGESASCDDDCTLAACGDGTLNTTAGEACDDAGASVECDADCTVAACGDGTLNMAAGEACDDAGESATCDLDCTPAECGDGVLNPSAGELCDDGGESAACNADCTPAACGDGIVNLSAGELCDDGGRSDACNLDCTLASCGDGIVNLSAGEQCDGDGAGTPGPTADCDADCTASQCGDGAVNPAAGEDCDGRGETAECNVDCTAAACGDGRVNVAAGEECDDGNVEDGDDCASDCTRAPEPGATEGAGLDDTTGASGASEGTTGSEPSTVTDTSSSSGMAMTGGSGGALGEESGGAGPGDDGCGCTATALPERRAPAWFILGLLGLVARRRRRPR